MENIIIKMLWNIFSGNIYNLYRKKNKKEIKYFFEHYFCKRKRMLYLAPNYTSKKILRQIYNEGHLNDFLTLVMSVEYLYKEFTLSNIELANHSNIILQTVNIILRRFDFLIIKTDWKSLLIKRDKKWSMIGEGSFAIIFKHNECNICIKRLKDNHLLDNKVVNRFKEEFRIMNSLKKFEGILQVYSFNIDEVYYTMELADENLYYHIINNKHPIKYKLKIIKEILTIIMNLHNNKIIHRDLSPENILLKNGKVKICDFGISKDLKSIVLSNTQRTEASQHYEYIDPVALSRLKFCNYESDIYSIGKLMNFIMTKNPFNQKHILESIVEIATSENLNVRYKSIDNIISDLINIYKFDKL